MTIIGTGRAAVLLAGCALGALLPTAAWAQSATASAEPEADEDADAAGDANGGARGEIVVTARRSGDAVSRSLIGSSVTVIDAGALASRETRFVSDVLRDVPGVAVNRNGGPGGLTQVRIRGAEGNHVLVFIDGIKASDPYQGEFDFATLLADDAARVEVLRGQQSSLYGSDAIGGVINYVTLSGREAPGIRLRAEGGSFGTYNGTARVAGASDSFSYALSGSFQHSRGYPTAPGGSRDVGAENGGASAKLIWTPRDNLRVTGVARYSHTRADNNDQDASAAAPVVSGRQVITALDTPGSYYKNEALYGLLRAELDSFDHAMTTAVSAQVADTGRDAYSVFGYSNGDRGVRYRGSLENTVRFGSDRVKNLFTLAVDAEREQFRNAAPTAPDRTTKRIDTLGVVAQYNLTVDERLALGGSVRLDKNDLYDDATTWHVDASYLFPTGTRPHAAAGTGIKNPGAFELFGYYTGVYIGNPDLKPEKSRGWEAGIDQSFAGGKATVGFTYFRNRLLNEIYTIYLPPDYSGTSLNRTTRTGQQGVEVFGQAKLGAIRVDASYTYLKAPQFRDVLLNPADPNSFATGPVRTQAVRRPKHSGSLNISYEPADQPFSGTLTVRHNGRMKDVVYTPSYSPLFADLDAYTLVNLALRYRLTDAVEVYGRAENLFDEKYQEIFTFDAPRRALYGGVRARF